MVARDRNKNTEKLGKKSSIIFSFRNSEKKFEIFLSKSFQYVYIDLCVK